MPIFTFKCEKCGEFEFIEPSPSNFLLTTGIDLFSYDAIIKCEKCGSDCSKVYEIGKSSFVLKGSGWYSTDYK